MAGPLDEYRFDQLDRRLDKIEAKFDERLSELFEKTSALRVDLVSLQIRAGMWGAIAGVIPAILTALLLWIRNP